LACFLIVHSFPVAGKEHALANGAVPVLCRLLSDANVKVQADATAALMRFLD